MLEHITRGLYYFEVHLLYASLVSLTAWVLTSLRFGSATTKYWIWVATALNFIVPAAAILDGSFESHLGWARPLGVIGDLGFRITHSVPTSVTISALWLLGAVLMATRLYLRIQADHREIQAFPQNLFGPRRGLLADGVPVRFAETRQAPAVNGVLHPHISLPQGIDRLLSEPELEAVLMHELTHARRRDNLIRLVYEITRCVLWFHPLVWITGSRLALYRELSCDESVIENAHGRDLVSALAKLANPEEPLLLQASASSFLSLRLAHLSAAQPKPASRGASALLAIVFTAALVAAVLGTVAHTACCWIARI